MKPIMRRRVTYRPKPPSVRTSLSLSDTVNQMKTSSLPPREIRAIISLETNGEFLQNLYNVMQATGMSLDQLFAHLSDALTAQREDRFPQSILTDGRLSDVESLFIRKILWDLTESLIAQTGRLVEQSESVRLLEVNEDANIACVEIVPLAMGATTTTPDAHAPRRKGMALKCKT